MRKFRLITFYLITALLLSSCGSSIDSTDNRYKHATEEVIIAKERPATTFPKERSEIEDFDFTPYMLPLENAKKKIFVSNQTEDNLWRNYPKFYNSKKVMVKQPGFRVQVLATDDLTEAQQKRSDIYFKTNKNEIYITFQSPLYKVKVGDYATHLGANNLAFKLNQLGFSPTQVVADTVNLLQGFVPKK